MTTPAVFLDRDGTLIEDAGFLRTVDQVQFFPQTFTALRRLRDAFALFIVTNQSGVAKGEITHEQAQTVNNFVVQRLREEGIDIRAVYCCPHERADGCDCIKPNPYFRNRAEREHQIDLARSFTVGDHPCDVELAAGVGASGIYVLTGHGAKHRDELQAPCLVVDDIGAAADAIAVAHAVALLREGGVVAIPTETVYGLGADAMNEAAVERVFRIKGRPTNHPLIVHLGEASQMSEWVREVPDLAATLAERFWPGPLTLILPKSSRVGDWVTGGQDSVGLRVPAHPLARKVLKEFGGGVAAPSANRFGQVSPTTAEHVRQDLGTDVDFIVDGGTCNIGIESTIVSLLSPEPVILRPGGVTQEEIEAALNRRVAVAHAAAVRAPGQLNSHYAPRAAVVLVAPHELEQQAAAMRAAGTKFRILNEADLAPEMLYSALRRADAEGATLILASPPTESGLGLAVADRLRKAAAPRPALE